MKKTKGANHDDLQQMNRALVLSLMRKTKVTTRADIAKATGLKRATITNIVSDFLEANIVKETGITEGDKGRRSIGISLNGFDYKVIAIRLARRHFSIGLYDITGQLYEMKRVSINFVDGSRFAMKLIKNNIKEMLKSSTGVSAIGVALPGPFIKSENKIVQISDFPGWEDVNIVDELSNEFNIPTFAEHDGKASALAEWWYSRQHTGDDILLNIAAGQGTGAGIVNHGSIYHGGHGLSGELGHTSISFDGHQCECGNRGCLDKYCSSIILMNNIKEKLQHYPDSRLADKYDTLTLDDIADAVKHGDELAVTEIKNQAKFLSYGIVNAVNIYDPTVVVITDEMAFVGGKVLLEEVKKGLISRLPKQIYDNIRVELTEIDNPMLTGAMAVAVDKLLESLNFMKK